MSNYKLPVGFRDSFGSLASKKEELRLYLSKLFKMHHYILIETPLLEYREVFKDYGIKFENLYRILETDGSDLALRPDLTLPIGRFLATTNINLPQSFAYIGEKFERNPKLKGLCNETTQAGIELIGYQSLKAELECLRVIGEMNEDLFKGHLTTELGYATFADLILDELTFDLEQRKAIKEALFTKNIPKYQHLIEKFNTHTLYPFLKEWIWLFGEVSQVKDTIMKLEIKDNIKKIFEKVFKLAELISKMGKNKVIVDFSNATPQKYYTGFIFRAYDERMGAYLISGGRYDNLLANFQDKSEAAIGMGIDITLMAKLLAKENKASKPILVYCTVSQWKECIKRYGKDLKYQICLAKNINEAKKIAKAKELELKILDEKGGLTDA